MNSVRHHDGYVQIVMHSHPHADKRGVIFAHRLIMEKHLGRYLTSEEDVHHINGIRNDNRIENLEVMLHGDHMRLHTKGKTFSEEHKTRISKSKKGVPIHTLESKQRIRERMIGSKHSEETKQKIRLSHIGRIVSEETKMKLKGHKVSESTREKIRQGVIAHYQNRKTQTHKSLEDYK